jgi:serine protease Do
LLLLFPFLPFFHTEDAEHAFSASSFGYEDEKARLEYRLAMIAAGHSREIAGDRFTRRLFDDVKAFQRSIGQEATGATTQAQVNRIFEQALPVLEGWALRSIRHPERGHAIWVPANLGLGAEIVAEGIFVWDHEDRFRVSFVHYPGEQTFDLMRLLFTDGVELPDWVIEDDHFIIESTLDGFRKHLHFHRDADGVTGIDIAWREEDAPVYGERLAAAISSSFWATMTGAPVLEMEPVEYGEDAAGSAEQAAAPI